MVLNVTNVFFSYVCTIWGGARRERNTRASRRCEKAPASSSSLSLQTEYGGASGTSLVLWASLTLEPGAAADDADAADAAAGAPALSVAVLRIPGGRSSRSHVWRVGSALLVDNTDEDLLMENRVRLNVTSSRMVFRKWTFRAQYTRKLHEKLTT